MLKLLIDMKLSEQYVDKYYGSDGWEGYILIRNLEDLLEISKLEGIIEYCEKDMFWDKCR